MANKARPRYAVDLRLVFTDRDLATKFERYVRERYGDLYGARVLVVKQALQEFLQRQQKGGGNDSNAPGER